MLLSIILVVVLLLCSALVSASEVAFFSLGPIEKDQLKLDQTGNANLARKLLAKPHELLASILIASNFINVGIVIISNSILNQVFEPNTGNETLRFILDVFLITFLLLLIGEVIPKIYATRNSIFLAKLMSRPLYLFGSLPPFSWFKSFLAYGTTIINRYASKRSIKISSDELEQALALTKEESTSEEEQKILQGIIKFGNTDVKQIMRSRMDVEAFEESSSFDEILTFILNAGYSRIPIYRKTLDEVTGILYIKDLLPYINEDKHFQWNKLIRPPFFVPENKKIDDLLKNFQSKKMHMAIVVDEYGGASGIITLEDILEEIIGDITDEFDEDQVAFTKISEIEYLFEGRTPLIDFYKILGIDGRDFELEKGDSDSLGGFMVEKSGRILRNKEFVRVGNVKLIVTSSDKRRIKTVKVTLEEVNEA